MDRVKLVAFLESERRLILPQRRLILPQFYQLSKTNPKFLGKNIFSRWFGDHESQPFLSFFKLNAFSTDLSGLYLELIYLFIYLAFILITWSLFYDWGTTVQ